MKTIINIATLFLQFTLTLVGLFVLYMLFAMFDYKGGIVDFVGLALFQPVFAILLSIATVMFCGLLGLPIRFIKRLNNWWRQHFYVSIFVTLIGFVACAFSLAPSLVEEVSYHIDGMDMIHTVPNQILSIGGWFLIGFGMLHTFPPKSLQDKIEMVFDRYWS